MEDYILSAKNIHLTFEDGNHVLRGIDFDIKKGERVVILGPSGSGKSTFLRTLNRLVPPSSGVIYFKNEPVTEKNIESVRSQVGMVFQHFNLINNLTVMENLTLAPVELKKLSESEAEKKARKLLKSIGLLEKRDSYPSSLSGGQKQRIAIVRAMMLDPEILLFDEPTSALDPESIKDVLELIRSLIDSGMTAIIVTHEISFAREIASRIVFIDKGEIIEENTPDAFFSNPHSLRARTFLKKVL